LTDRHTHPNPTGTDTRSALVVASFGRHVLVEQADGQRVLCHPRGKKNEAVVGDQIQWLPSADEGTIERIGERRNLLYRRDEWRTKSFAANLDQVLVLLAAEPEFSESQLARALIACHAQQLPVLIGLNKQDLQVAFDKAWARLAPYRQMQEQVLPLAIKPGTLTPDLSDLRSRLQGKTTLVLGPSGAGKSSLVNALVPDAGAATAEISRALASGRHTTTRTMLYWLDEARQTALIDSPGFQEFGLHHIPATALANLMPDLHVHAQQCRFHNCSHRHEPGCGVTEALESSNPAERISPSRYRIYLDLFDELSQPARY
jgi:ribosome biogenesis GTPase